MPAISSRALTSVSSLSEANRTAAKRESLMMGKRCARSPLFVVLSASVTSVGVRNAVTGLFRGANSFESSGPARRKGQDFRQFEIHLSAQTKEIAFKNKQRSLTAESASPFHYQTNPIAFRFILRKRRSNWFNS